jgi:hypothetical protein
MWTVPKRKVWSRGYIPGLYLLFLFLWCAWMLIQVVLYLIKDHQVNPSFLLGRRWWGALVEVSVLGLLLLFIPCGCGSVERVVWNDTEVYNSMFPSWQEEQAGDCPASVEELVRSSGKAGGSTKDPWDNDYTIICPGLHAFDLDVCSSGPDQQKGTTDDICNWKPQPK